MKRVDRDAYLEQVLVGGREPRAIVIVDYDARWPGRFAAHRDRVARTLGPMACSIEHIGSTAVPGLAAKPIIDLLVAVKDPEEESVMVPAMAAAGYQLRVREPGHRMFRTPERDVHPRLATRRPRDLALPQVPRPTPILRRGPGSLRAPQARTRHQTMGRHESIRRCKEPTHRADPVPGGRLIAKPRPADAPTASPGIMMLRIRVGAPCANETPAHVHARDWRYGVAVPVEARHPAEQRTQTGHPA